MMNINKEKVMVTTTKFEEIKKELDNNYYTPRMYACNDGGQHCEALKIALDKLLILLDSMV